MLGLSVQDLLYYGIFKGIAIILGKVRGEPFSLGWHNLDVWNSFAFNLFTILSNEKVVNHSFIPSDVFKALNTFWNKDGSYMENKWIMTNVALVNSLKPGTN
jgi:hypothetical protein